MILSRETNRRCNVVDWLINNLSITTEEVIEIMLQHRFNTESVKNSLSIPEEAMNRLMV